MNATRFPGLIAALTTLAWGSLHAQVAASAQFDHLKHQKLFPTCQACHPGVVDSTRSIWPTATGCAACHDGRLKDSMTWSPPEGPLATNLRFTHGAHRAAVRTARGADSSLSCSACHVLPGQPRMAVQPAPIQGNCFACHGIKTAHLAAPDSACVTCHVPLAQASALSAVEVAQFPAPPSHDVPQFMGAGGHGALAQHAKMGGHKAAVAPSCTVCHAQNFCVTCHGEVSGLKPVLALAQDPRSVVLAQPRRRPSWHGTDFSDTHAKIADAYPTTCTACHARTMCLECHRLNPARATGYHPSGFLTKHPAQAYSRATKCADCHNTNYFCATCHQQSGLVAKGQLKGGYHNADQQFLLGHGQAARQSLESCVTCHAERDCLTCHSAVQGRGFNPHGPGFDASRLKKENPQMCSACHGSAIPG
jgi:Doubled CXXCH motif (Paired_CXXCH_1)